MTCRFDGCGQRGGTRGLCHKHYQSELRAGRASQWPRVRIGVERGCDIDGCDKTHYAHGYCANHARRLVKHGDPLGGRMFLGKDATCTIDGCDRPHKTGGFCNMHYARKHRTGDPNQVRPRRRIGIDPCEMPGCERVQYRSGLCGHHAYMRSRIIAETTPDSQMRRYPAEPLRSYCRERGKWFWLKLRAPLLTELNNYDSVTDNWFHKELGLSGSVWLADTWTEVVVDAVCTFMHTHPVLFYPDYLLDPHVAGAFAGMLAVKPKRFVRSDRKLKSDPRIRWAA